MTVSEEAGTHIAPPKRSRLSLNKKNVKISPAKSDDISSAVTNNGDEASSIRMEFPGPRTPDAPVVVQGSADREHHHPQEEEQEEASLVKQRTEKPVIASFNNLGNTCFLNSVLQILRYTPQFVPRLNHLSKEILSAHKQKLLLSEDQDGLEVSGPWKLVRCLSKLFVRMSRVEEKFTEYNDDYDLVLQPDKLLDVIRQLNPMYEGNFQHDAQELLHGILCFIKDAVHELVEFHSENPVYDRPSVAAVAVANDDAKDRKLVSYDDMVDATDYDAESVTAETMTDELGGILGERSAFPVNGPADVNLENGDIAATFPNDDDELFDKSAATPDADNVQGQLENAAMQTEDNDFVRNSEGVHTSVFDTIDSVLNGETHVDWAAIHDDEEIAFNLDNPSSSLCDENLAIAESLKDAAAMASVASAFNDGKLTPKTPTPKTTPKPSPEQSELDMSFTSVIIEMCCPGERSPGTILRASISSSAISVEDTIEVLDELEAERRNDESFDVFSQPIAMRGGARRETPKPAGTKTRLKTSPVSAAPAVRKSARKAAALNRNGLTECNGDFSTEAPEISSRKNLDELSNGYMNGKENIPLQSEEAKDFVFNTMKTYSKKRTVKKEIMNGSGPVRRSPRKLTQQKNADIEESLREIIIEPEVLCESVGGALKIEVQSNGRSPETMREIALRKHDDEVVGLARRHEVSPASVPKVETRKRNLSPNSELEPKTKRHSNDETKCIFLPEPELSPRENNQPTILNYFPRRNVKRRLGMRGELLRNTATPAKAIDLTSSQPGTDGNDVGNDVTCVEYVSLSNVADVVDITNELAPNTELESNTILPNLNDSEDSLRLTALNNAQTATVRLEKCNLKEKFPNLKVSITPPRKLHFDSERCQLVEKLFQGTVALRTRCRECEGYSDRHESFQDVSVPVKQITDLARLEDRRDQDLSDDEDNATTPRSQSHWMLKELSEVEHLREENKYFCDSCNQFVEAERSTHYDVMPSILTLHLKRFAATSGFFGGLSKITDHVTIPLTLPCFGARCAQPCLEHRYDLYGLVMHSGVTITSGHYVSYVRLPPNVVSTADDDDDDDDDVCVIDPSSRLVPKWSLAGRWIECDDDQIKVLTESEFDHVLSESNFGTPYVLFYTLLHGDC